MGSPVQPAEPNDSPTEALDVSPEQLGGAEFFVAVSGVRALPEVTLEAVLADGVTRTIPVPDRFVDGSGPTVDFPGLIDWLGVDAWGPRGKVPLEYTRIPDVNDPELRSGEPPPVEGWRLMRLGAYLDPRATRLFLGRIALPVVGDAMLADVPGPPSTPDREHSEKWPDTVDEWLVDLDARLAWDPDTNAADIRALYGGIDEDFDPGEPGYWDPKTNPIDPAMEEALRIRGVPGALPPPEALPDPDRHRKAALGAPDLPLIPIDNRVAIEAEPRPGAGCLTFVVRRWILVGGLAALAFLALALAISQFGNSDEPAAADEPDVPATANEPDVPATADESDVPEAADEPDVPATANESDVPATADESDVPEAADESDVPEAADEPDIPATADDPDVPEAADEPDVPEAPAAAAATGDPVAPDDPDVAPAEPQETPEEILRQATQSLLDSRTAEIEQTLVVKNPGGESTITATGVVDFEQGDAQSAVSFDGTMFDTYVSNDAYAFDIGLGWVEAAPGELNENEDAVQAGFGVFGVGETFDPIAIAHLAAAADEFVAGSDGAVEAVTHLPVEGAGAARVDRWARATWGPGQNELNGLGVTLRIEPQVIDDQIELRMTVSVVLDDAIPYLPDDPNAANLRGVSLTTETIFAKLGFGVEPPARRAERLRLQLVLDQL